jgi:hypothetical protein
LLMVTILSITVRIDNVAAARVRIPQRGNSLGAVAENENRRADTPA